MVDKVKCGNKVCKLFDVVVPVSNLYINKVAPLDGPWPCPECGDEMKIAHVIPNKYKGNGSKAMPSAWSRRSRHHRGLLRKAGAPPKA